jgi:4-amino-4-deoxy-L-arabinose transferase-like glycosyltransferase
MGRLLNNRAAVYWGVVIFSGLLSLYRIATRDLINGDGIKYIDVARTFLNEGLISAIDVYHWPFYSILIGLVHRTTGLEFEDAASLLNIFFLVIVCVAFVRIYEEISGKQARIWIAAILILTLPILNDYRDFVIRGYGYWAFMLLALFYFIRYNRSPGLANALKWQLSIALAILFRIEGIAFLILAPFFFLFIAGERRRILSHIARLNGLFISLAVVALIYMLVSGTITLSSSMELPYQLDYASPTALIGAVDAEAAMMFDRNRFMSSVDDARLILASGVLVLVLVEVLSNIGLPFLAVWGYGIRRKWLQLTRESRVVMYFAATGFLVLVPVAGNFFFISARHTVFTVLLISLITFQYVDYLLRRLSSHQQDKWHIAVWVIILGLFLDGVISGGTSKKNIRVAGEWVKAELAAEERIACNEARLEFYSDNRCKWIVPGDVGLVDIINDLKKDGYTYLLFWVGRKDEQLRSAVEGDTELVLIKEFLNRKGSSVRLYSVQQGRQ